MSLVFSIPLVAVLSDYLNVAAVMFYRVILIEKRIVRFHFVEHRLPQCCKLIATVSEGGRLIEDEQGRIEYSPAITRLFHRARVFVSAVKFYAIAFSIVIFSGLGEYASVSFVFGRQEGRGCPTLLFLNRKTVSYCIRAICKI